MAHLTTILDNARTILAVATLLCYFVALRKRKKEVRTPSRNTNAFFVLLALLFLLIVADITVSFCWLNLVDDDVPLPTSLYGISITFQLDGLWKPEKQPPWYGLVVSWALMVLFEILSLAQYYITMKSTSTTPAMLGSLSISIFRLIMLLGLIFWFVWTGLRDRYGYSTLPTEDHLDADDMADGDSDCDEDGSRENQVHSKAQLSKLVEQEIADAGSKWAWLKKFFVFWPWIWPQGQRRLQLRMWLTGALIVLESFPGLLEPSLEGKLIDSIFEGAKQQSMGPVWLSLINYLVVSLVTSNLGIASLKEYLVLDVNLYRDQKKDSKIYSHVMRLDADYHDRENPTDTLSAAQLGSQITRTLDRIVTDIVPEMIKLVGAAIHVSFQYGWRVALIQAYVVILYSLNMQRSMAVVTPRMDRNRPREQAVDRRKNDGVRGWKTVRRHNQTDKEIKTYDAELDSLTRRRRTVLLISQAFRWSSNLILQSGLWFATLLVIFQIVLSDHATGGSMIAFWGYWRLILTPLTRIMNFAKQLNDDMYNADRLRRIMAAKPNIMQGSRTLQSHQRAITLNKVKVSFDKETTSEELNLEFPAGKNTAIIGPSGVGKSTILDCILRVRDITTGTITIGGTNIADLRFDSLRTHVGILPQVSNDAIFKNTVEYNVRYAKQSATKQEVENACRMARLHDDIMSRADGYNSDASTLSLGQKQRLLWAQIFIANPAIVLLDEPTASLDGENAAAIKATADSLFSDHTVIMVSHLMSVVKDSDQIIVLGKGCKVIQVGTHESLLEDEDGHYAMLWRKHLGKKEVEHTVEEILDHL